MLEWTDGARNVYLAAAEAALPDSGRLVLKRTLGAIMARTAPDRSLIGRVLLAPDVWPLDQRAHVVEIDDNLGAHPHIMYLAEQSEARARQDGLLRVGERHVADQIVAWWGADLRTLGLDPEMFQQQVRDAELGIHFTNQELARWWHGMIDANIIVQAKPIDNIVWPEVTQQPRVMLWIVSSLLNELDEMTYYHNKGYVRERAGAFTKDLRGRLEDALQPMGIELRTNVRLAVWAPVAPAGMRDRDHLESAIELRERGLPIHVVTQDSSLAARALMRGIGTLSLPVGSMRPPAPTPEERDLKRRVRDLEQQVQELQDRR